MNNTDPKITASPIVNNLTLAMIRDDYRTIEAIIRRSRDWCEGTNDDGYTILQESMRQDKTIIFDNLLQYQDLVNLESVNRYGENALTVAVNMADRNDYYASQIIQKGAYLHGVSQFEGVTLLHRAVLKASVSVTRMLLEKGVNVNVRDGSGYTPLHKTLFGRRSHHELIAMLLYYGADPLARVAGYNAFEMSMRHKLDDSIQEILFHYTFDIGITSELSFKFFLHMLPSRPPILTRLSNYTIQCYVEDRGYVHLFLYLLRLGVENLRLLLVEYDAVIRNCLNGLTAPHLYYRRENAWNDMYHLLGSGAAIQQLSIMLENVILREYVVYFFRILDPHTLATTTIEAHLNDAERTSQVLTFYLLCGLRIDRRFVHHIYERFGYADIFKLLLHLDYEDEPPDFRNSAMVASIRDIDFSLNTFFLDRDDNYNMCNVEAMMGFFASAKFRYYFERNRHSWHISDASMAIARSHPNLPRLQEIARNVLRKYIVQCFNVTTTKGLYAYINNLPIGVGYKRVVTLEQRLYD